MSEVFEPYLISCPFIETSQIVTSPRYYWENMNRGDSFVIIQRSSSGFGIFEIDGVAHPVPPEHAFIAIAPEESVYYYPREATEPWEFSWINFYGEFGNSLMRRFRERHGPVIPLPSHSPAGARFLEMGSGKRAESKGPMNLLTDPFESSNACYRFIMEWAKQLTPKPNADKNDPVENAIALCSLRFREPLGVKELANATGLTREHFTRVFTARTGKSPAAYLRDLRLDAARTMLQEAIIPLSEVALRCGFPSLRSLKSALGETAY